MKEVWKFHIHIYKDGGQIKGLSVGHIMCHQNRLKHIGIGSPVCELYWEVIGIFS